MCRRSGIAAMPRDLEVEGARGSERDREVGSAVARAVRLERELGAAVGGIAVDRLGAHAAYAVPVAAGLVAVLLAGVRYRPLLRAERAASGS